MTQRIRVNTMKLADKLEQEIPEVICTPKDDEYQITVTLLKPDGITFNLLSPRIQQQLSHGYLNRKDYADLVRTLNELL